MAVTQILTDSLTICNNTTKLSVVLENISSTTIDFNVAPTELHVDITGDMTNSFTYPLTNRIISALKKDTIDISSALTLPNGTYNIVAYLGVAIDNNPINDTAKSIIDIHPALTVVATQVSSQGNCLQPNMTINQEVSITNSGNMDMEDLVLLLEVSNSTGAVVETLHDTIFGIMTIGNNVVYTFREAYTVPNDEQYNVAVTVYPICNSSATYQSGINECIELNDLAIDGILVPSNDGTCSRIGDRLGVKVKVSNKNPNDDAHNVEVYAKIIDNDGNQLADWTETINTIYADDYEEVEFAPFTIPSVASYTVQAYLLNNNDIDASNDTAAPVSKCTDLTIKDANANGISMSQNIPNPANGMTKVNYVVPQDGKVMFNIMSVTGQILYTEEFESVAGENSIEFNTESLSSGIYFYSMTFNGQRIVKKMTIEK